MNSYHRKQPRKLHLPRCHWNKKHGRYIKVKFPYDTLSQAEEYIKENNLVGYEAYLCPICNKYHIGHKNGNKR